MNLCIVCRNLAPQRLYSIASEIARRSGNVRSRQQPPFVDCCYVNSSLLRCTKQRRNTVARYTIGRQFALRMEADGGICIVVGGTAVDPFNSPDLEHGRCLRLSRVARDPVGGIENIAESWNRRAVD